MRVLEREAYLMGGGVKEDGLLEIVLEWEAYWV